MHALDRRSSQQVWDECDRGDWLIWLSIVDGMPVVAMVDAAIACAQRAMTIVEREQRLPLRRALAAAETLESSETCRKRARACEKIAGKVDAANYRDSPPTKLAWAATAAARAARAAEALVAAEVRRSGELDFEGRARAAGIGAGDQIIPRGDMAPLVFQMGDDLMAMCVHAAASAVVFSARALAPPDADEAQFEVVEGRLSEVVFEVLDPVRNGLLRGEPAERLVRGVSVEPYGATLATLNRTGKALTPIGDLGKRPMNAMAAALLCPVGGLGHLYAGHVTTGTILLVGGILSLAAHAMGFVSVLSWLVIVIADVALARRAVEQHNNKTVPYPRSQAVYALGAVVLAMLVGLSGL